MGLIVLSFKSSAVTSTFRSDILLFIMRVHSDTPELQAVATIEEAKAAQITLEVQQTNDDRDGDELVRLGKKPVLKVDFSPPSRCLTAC